MNLARSRLLAIAASAALLALLWWTSADLAASRRRMGSAHKDLADIQTTILKIDSSRRQPRPLASADLQPVDLARRIDAAAAASGFPVNHIVRIEPASPRRLADSPFTELSVHLSLKDVTLRQAIALLHALSSADEALNARSLRLAAPRADDSSAQLWDVESTLTCLIHSPQTNTTDASAAANP